MNTTCNRYYFTNFTAVLGVLLMAGMTYAIPNFDFADNEQVLILIIIGIASGLVFLVASDLMRKALKLQERIAKLEEQVASLTQLKK